ncbi:MAG: glycosyltransferase family 39 protein [Lachnospiraceae bacterium]|nr:glycosyltransferase family 39 protein [Lachnospiraceae bacterium]
MLIGFFIRAYYVSYISVIQNQHDSGTVLSEYGHLGYINWFLRHDHLPDFDVRTLDQFWHPPLHYMLAAYFLKICWRLFPSLSGNYELIQALPLLYVTIASFLTADILRLIMRKDSTAFFLALSFSVFSPAMVICAASVNNDALLMMLSCLTLDLAIRWFRDPKTYLIISLAVSFGLSMSTKKTASLLAFPIALLFAVRFIGIDNASGPTRRKLLEQFGLFLVIASPLALWWYIRNYQLYGVPMGYVWSIDDPAGYEAYLGHIPSGYQPGHRAIQKRSGRHLDLELFGRQAEKALLSPSAFTDCCRHPVDDCRPVLYAPQYLLQPV